MRHSGNFRRSPGTLAEPWCTCCRPGSEADITEEDAEHFEKAYASAVVHGYRPPFLIAPRVSCLIDPLLPNRYDPVLVSLIKRRSQTA